MNNRGETLLELIMSIGLFAIVMLMVATMFAAANKSTMRNYATEKKIDENITRIVKEEDPDSVADVQVVFKTNEGKTVTVTTEKINAGSFYKYRSKH